MCGISGLVDFNQNSDLNLLKEMTDSLAHRGPDDGGYSFVNNESAQIGLGHRRLAVLDLSSNGHQPMEFKHLTIVYNGEVYNFKEIRTVLIKLGYFFESDSDTEVVLKAYYEWGLDSVNRFNGMFSFAIFDKRNQTLTLIRDRAGVKPLYWYFKNNLFLFASELKSFNKHPEFQKKLNIEAVSLYLSYGYIPQPHSIFENTYKLNAGCVLCLDIETKEVKKEKYWDIVDFYKKKKIQIDENEAINEVENLLKASCKLRMVSDVPAGVFLSGGYDSSVITALLQNERSDRIKTFSIGFEDDKINEAHHAKKVAMHLGTDHTEYYCTYKDAIDILPKIPYIWDEPFADKSVIPTVLVSQLARGSVTVALSADGGDELFGGYAKYTEAQKINSFLSRVPMRENLAWLMNKAPFERLSFDNRINNFARKYNRLTSIVAADGTVGIMENLQIIFLSSDINQLMLESPSAPLTEFSKENNTLTNNFHLDNMLAVDFKTYQLDDILVKVDRATMAASLEGREPMLDRDLIEFVATLDEKLKIKGRHKKYLLKTIAHKYIPKEILDRPKQGFSAPIASWFKDELRDYLEAYLNREVIERQAIFNYEYIENLKSRFLLGEQHLAQKVWTLIAFQMWFERWMKG